MSQLRKEAIRFVARKREEAANAGQIAAMSLACGIDLDAALTASAPARAALIRQVRRIIERERIKGMRRHWSYDLNRHIALKQVLDRLRGPDRAQCAAESQSEQDSARQNGARGRR